MSIEMDLISIAINSVLALAAVIAVVYAYKTVKENKKALEAQFAYDLLKEYMTEEMARNVGTLYNFKRLHPDVAKAYKELYKERNPLDLARRGVSHYYQRIARLRDADYVSELFVNTLVNPNKTRFLREIVIPIEKAHAQKVGAPPFDEHVFDCLFKIVEH